MAINDIVQAQIQQNERAGRLLRQYLRLLPSLTPAILQLINALPRREDGTIDGIVSRRGASNLLQQAGFASFTQPLRSVFGDLMSERDRVLDVLGIQSSPPDELALNASLDFALGQFEQMEIRIATAISQSLQTAAVVPISNAAMREQIETITRRSKDQAQTIMETSIARMQREIARKAIDDLPQNEEKFFLYIGGLIKTSRDFCKELNGKAIRQKDVGQLRNGQGLPVATFGGGYNCRHSLIPITDTIRRERNIPIASVVRANSAAKK